jgi:hypothetical protein
MEIFTVIGMYAVAIILGTVIVVAFNIAHGAWETAQEEKKRQKDRIEGLWSLMDRLSDRLANLEQDPTMWTQDADLGEQLEAHANLDQQRFQKVHDILDLLGRRTKDLDADFLKVSREVKEEFVRVERRADILDRAMSSFQRRTNENFVTQDILIRQVEKDANARADALLAHMEKLNATQDNPTERESSGVEPVDEDALQREKPSGQGEETGGASGYPPVNYRRDYPRA